MSSDQLTVRRLVAERIATSLTGDPTAADAAAGGAVERASTERRSGAESLAWIAHYLADELLAPIEPIEYLDQVVLSTPLREWTRREWREHLRGLDVGDRVVVLIHYIAGYDIATTAAICRRPEPEIEAGCILDSDERRRGTKGRRRRDKRNSGAGVVTSIVLLISTALAVTHGGGERPSFASVRPDALDDLDARPGCTASSPLPAGASELDIEIGGTQRRTRVWIPGATSATTPLPLILDLGDYGSDPVSQSQSTKFELLADGEQFVVATPAPTGELPQWNVTGARSVPDDVAFLSAVIGRVAHRACIDPMRVTVVGHGDGAHMAAALACRRSDRIAAFVMVGGTFVPPDCGALRPISVLGLVDGSDQVFPKAGGYGPGFDHLAWSREMVKIGSDYQPQPTSQNMARWAEIAGCDQFIAEGVEGADGRIVASATGCMHGQIVITRSSSGRGHGWPDDGAQVAWAFLRDRSLR